MRPGVPPPPSLVNMYKELHSDVGFRIPDHNGYLAPWARQGMLLLNAVLTVRAHTPNSHKNKGWETFTDAVLRAVDERRDPVVFVLWGAYAQKKAKLVDASRHTVIQSAHPSPLSARNGFFGSRPFSAINEALRRHGKPDDRLATAGPVARRTSQHRQADTVKRFCGAPESDRVALVGALDGLLPDATGSRRAMRPPEPTKASNCRQQRAAWDRPWRRRIQRSLKMSLDRREPFPLLCARRAPQPLVPGLTGGARSAAHPLLY